MGQSLARNRRLLAVIAVLVGLAVAYMGLSLGLADAAMARLFRPNALHRLDMAAEADPPNVGYLLRAARGWDWYVAAGAAEHLAELRREGRLADPEAASAAETLMEVLGLSGHWWRFGWDTEEAEFEAFQGEAINALASFGQPALPTMGSALESRSPHAREAACWALYTMLSQGSLNREAITSGTLWSRVEALTNDRESGVRYACRCLREATDQD